MTMPPSSNKRQDFDIPLGEHLLSSFLHATRHLWRRLGSIESSALAHKFEATTVDRPIYVTGLARSGSTILLEMIAAHGDVATHTYRDFWSIFTPLWSSQATRALRKSGGPPVERAHGDRIMITPDSPEAIEEMLWMAFFHDLHDPTVSNAMGPETENRPFERFYRDHIRKLLLLRESPRYASKANYNLTRLGYLIKLFPDARFVLPIRNPLEQIASLQKQHLMLTDAAARYPRSLCYLDRVGHFEFGAHRTPINAGDSTAIEQVIACWQQGEEVRGWARYWSHLYGFLADQLEDDDAVRSASLVVPYETLCGDSHNVLSRLFGHCELDAAEQVIEHYAPMLQRPSYYKPDFSFAERQAIEEETAEVVERFASLASFSNVSDDVTGATEQPLPVPSR